MPVLHIGRGGFVADAIRAIRRRNGWSQRQLAIQMGVPRTYVSKIENDKVSPTMFSLERIAEALGVTIPEVLNNKQDSKLQEMRELLSDDFIAKLLPHVHQLSMHQLGTVVTRVRELSSARGRMTA